MAPSGVHSRNVGTPKRVPVWARVNFTVTVRVEFRHSELILQFQLCTAFPHQNSNFLCSQLRLLSFLSR